ncbi:hypothetical protein C0J52_13643 [Blattella germanica]|nr:hypothetical protein C0J52_13643 [Blattella germanica]
MMSHHPASILLVLLLAFGTVLSEEGGTICSSVDVRNTVGDLEQLSGCRVVEGFVRVVLIDKANASDYDGISFPQLREITDYLLFYRAAGLLSLGSLFPNLTVIRGNSLFVDYALVVYDMMHITELGLGSLTTILRGSVRIENNRHLCFLQSVDWKSIIVHGELYATNNNPEQVLCPACPAACEDHHCWGQSVCQKVPQKDDDGCDEQCLGGCSGPGPDRCSACTRVVDENGICAQNCPPDRFEFMGRRCVTEEQCRASEVPSVHLQRTVLPGLPSKAWIPFNGSCCLMCPLGYQPVLNEHGKHTCERCVGYCRKVCGSGDRIPVESIFHIQQLNGCTYINGSLIVRLLMGKQILQELEDNLDGIEEISGFLKVYFSYPLTSLNFFKKLRVIHGTDLENGQFALVIVRNDNLQELWNWESRPKNFTIKNGTLSIHSNPKLCMSEVDEFLHIAGFHNDSAVEISLESNGNNIACRPIKMAAHVTVINSTSAQVEWGSFRDARNLLGFIVHYKETRDENVTLHKDFDECEDDDWRVAYVILNSQTTNMSHVITQLKPFTLYAFYVETYSTVSATVGGRSSIQFFRTFPDRPSIPRYLRAYSNSSSEVVLHWQPPLFPNGEISHYIIVGWRHYDDRILLEQRDYCRFPLEPRKKEDEEQLLLNQPEVKDSCCKPATCMSNDDARFNFIYTQEAVNEEQGPCEQQTSIYSVLYSHRLYGNGGGIYDTHGDFQQQTEGNSTTALVSDLHHFAEYTIKVVACRKSHLGTINHAWNDSHCSPASLITTRTRKLEAADDVDSSLVKVEVSSGGTVRVFWLEPSHPNGIVVSYHVEYRRTDIVNFEPVFLCLTSLQFERAKNWYVLNNMAPGKYSIRIRATSLAGDSSFTDFVEFAVRQEVVPRSYKSEIIILSTVILTLFAVLSGLTFCFWKKLKSEKILEWLLTAHSFTVYATYCDNMSEGNTHIEFGILTVSDSCFRGQAEDKSGSNLADIINTGLIPNGKVVLQSCVPDEEELIKEVLEEWCDRQKIDVILTTGGTGFSPRDVTPEATRKVIHKEAPGLAVAMLKFSLNITPFAMLSRAVAGIRDKTLIVNLPGSTKASQECLQAISATLPHAVDPSRIARRARESPFPMIDVTTAQRIVLEHAEVLGTERLAFSDTLGRVLAEDVYSKDPLPPFPASIKDGYAPSEQGRLQPGQCLRINTGAPVPLGADSVVQVEDTKLLQEADDGKTEVEIEILVAPKMGQDIRPVGSDMAQGQLVLPRNSILGPSELGLLATAGVTTVLVHRLPVVAVLSTGNEVQDPTKPLEEGHIRDSNKTTLLSLMKEHGFPTVDCGIARDNPESVVSKLREALGASDLVMTTGGVSMGEKDLLKDILVADFGAVIHFGRVKMKPGKPTTFSTLVYEGKKKLVLGLPGNPVSATVTSHLYVLPALRKISGFLSPLGTVIKATAQSNVIRITALILRMSLRNAAVE